MFASYAIFNEDSNIRKQSINNLIEIYMYRDNSFAEIFGVEPANYINVQIQRIGFSGRVTNALKRAGYTTLDNFLHCSLFDFCGVRNIGLASVRESIEILRTYLSEYIFYDEFVFPPIKNHELYKILTAILNDDDYVMPFITESEKQLISKCIKAVELIDAELCLQALQKSQHVQHIMENLFKFYMPILRCYDYKKSIIEEIMSLDEYIRKKPAKPFIQAYYNNPNRIKCDYLLSINDTLPIHNLACKLSSNDLHDSAVIQRIMEFILWLNYGDFDKMKYEISAIFSNIKDRDRAILRMHYQKKMSLSSIAEIYNITLERVRQIVRERLIKIKDAYAQCTYDVIGFVHALNESPQITLRDISKIISKKLALELWPAISKGKLNCEFYKYSKDIDAVVFSD